MRTALVVWWVRLCASTARGVGLSPDWGTKIPHAMHCDQKKKKREREKDNSITDLKSFSNKMKGFFLFCFVFDSLKVGRNSEVWQAGG